MPRFSESHFTDFAANIAISPIALRTVIKVLAPFSISSIVINWMNLVTSFEIESTHRAKLFAISGLLSFSFRARIAAAGPLSPPSSYTCLKNLSNELWIRFSSASRADAAGPMPLPKELIRALAKYGINLSERALPFLTNLSNSSYVTPSSLAVAWIAPGKRSAN